MGRTARAKASCAQEAQRSRSISARPSRRSAAVNEERWNQIVSWHTRGILSGALLGLAIAVVPAIAASETGPTIEAVNKPGSGFYAEEHHAWSPDAVAAAAGGTVAIRNTGAVAHGVHWVAGPTTPTCSGVPVGTERSASGAHWSGTCTFAQAGTYVFYCTVHGPEMTGRITVGAAGTPVPTPSPLAGSASEAVKLARSQRGRAVRGAIDVSEDGAGARLEVDLLAKRVSLAAGGQPGRVRVGRLVRASLQPGADPLRVALDARARRALATHRRLTLDVRIVVTPASGSIVTITRSVVLHA
jgi:plastocyanin